MRSAVAVFTVGLGAVLLAQDPQTPRFRVAVDAVRIDAVVTDKAGRVVRDLTAADFEIFQDGKAQQVTMAQFVPVASGGVPAAAPPARLGSTSIAGAAPVPPAGAVRREHIQRTLAVVVDDLGMSVESLNYVKRGLHTFLDTAVQPGDLVAVVRTGGTMNGLQPFTTDKRVLHATVDNLTWNVFSRSGVEAFAAVNEAIKVKDSGHGPMNAKQTEMVAGDFAQLEASRNNVMAAGTLGALNLIIQGARDLPGRKAVLFVSEGFMILEQEAFDTMPLPGRVRVGLDRALDQAARAGVVIYSIDARGLQTGGLIASDDTNCAGGCETREFDNLVRSSAAGRNANRRDTQVGMTYLAEQTGGFAVLNTSDLGKGLARAAADVRDYYVLGYAPDEHTFPGKGKPAQFHKISVKVRRPGLTVRTRKEFLGVSDADTAAAAPTPAQQLVNAAISPFTSTDIALRATSLPGYAPDRGLFVRALLHIDARALTFVKGDGDRRTASADVLGMVFDRDGTEVAHLSTGFEAALTNEAADDALRDGLAYTLRIPIRDAGPYQIRFAVRDRASGAFGTAGEFIEVPDVPHGTFALSGIVMRPTNATSNAVREERAVISPSEALRVYAPGTQLKYAYEVYNASAPVKVAISVWRGPQRVMTAPPDTLSPPAGPERWFAASGAFKLGEALPPGSYVLQIAATTADPSKSGKIAHASQLMDFEVSGVNSATPQLPTPK